MGKSNRGFNSDRGDKVDRRQEHKAYRQETRSLLRNVIRGSKITEEEFENVDDSYQGKFSDYYNDEE